MPFKSEKQRRYLWANEPKIAREWTDRYGAANGGVMNVAMQGGGPNYLGKQPVVKDAPKYWQSSPDHEPAELAYITPEERDILIDLDLYGSLNGSPNRGPAGIMSLQGDLGGYSGSGSSGPSGSPGGGGDPTPWRNTQQYKVLTRGQYNPKTRSFKDDRIAKGARGVYTSPHLQPDATKFGFDPDRIRRNAFRQKFSRNLGGFFGGLGKGLMSLFGGVPGKLMSGFLTAKDYANKFGSGIKEFSEHENLMSYLNRNKKPFLDDETRLAIMQDPDLAKDMEKEFRIRNPLDLNQVFTPPASEYEGMWDNQGITGSTSALDFINPNKAIASELDYNQPITARWSDQLGVDIIPAKVTDTQKGMIDSAVKNYNLADYDFKNNPTLQKEVFENVKQHDDTGSSGVFGIGARDPEPMTDQEYKDYLISQGYI